MNHDDSRKIPDYDDALKRRNSQNRIFQPERAVGRYTKDKKRFSKTRQAVVTHRPHLHQAKFILSNSQTAVAIAGARSGKTIGGAMRFFDRAINQPGYTLRQRSQGIPYKLVAGTNTHALTQRVIRPAFEQVCPPELKIGKYHHTERLRKVHGRYGQTYIYFLSARDPESWLGLDLNGVWIDEAATVPEEMFDEAQTRIANQQGWIQLTGTPRGPNWLKKRVYDPWRQNIPGIDLFQWRTVDNPYFPREELERKKVLMPERYFRRTFEATFDTFEGQIYEDFLEAVHVLPAQKYSFKIPGRQTPVGKGSKVIELEKVVAGVDWGFSDTHPGCIVVGGLSRSGIWYLLEESYESQVPIFCEQPHDCWVRRALELRARWNIEAFYCDSAEPEHIHLFNAHGLHAEPADKSVEAGIEYVAELLKVDERTGFARMNVLNVCKNCIDEIQYYHWKDGKPVKVMDHTCDAIRYMTFTYKKRGVFRRELGYVPRRRRRIA